MDKNKIKKYAINARTELINAIKVKLATLGIDENEIQDKLSISTPDKEYYVDDNEANALTGAQIGWRKDIVAELNRHGYQEDSKTAYKDFVEEVAYTWFNRIIAIRFMEVNNYLPSRVRVLSSEEGRNEPDIINEAMEISDDIGGYSNQEKELITSALTEKTPELMDSLYTMLFIKQCDALSEILPGLFEETSNYLKLLFTPHYDRGVIKELIDEIPEEYFDVEKEGQVQIIGWLYQYYNSEAKDYVIGLPKSKKYRSTQIAEATQIFTPDWIVKYMVQNSLGKFWINVLKARHKDLSEKDLVKKFNWKYYMLDAPQTEKVSERMDKENAKLKKYSIEDLKVIDPAMGSGHILSYIFDVLIQIYESEGYSRRDAATKIVEHNLYGLDIDNRAYQLGYFEVLMKYREYNRRAFRLNKNIHVLSIPSSVELNGIDIKSVLTSYFNKETVNSIENLIQSFTYGKDEGSLLKIKENINFKLIKDILDDPRIISSIELQHIFKYVKLFYKVAKILNQQYEIIVTNPPYMGSSRMNKELSSFAKKNFKNSKSDLFAMFLESWNGHLASQGYCAMVTMQSWMFLSSFEKMRKQLLKKYTISNLMHMENNVMGIAFGTAVTITHLPYDSEFKGTYHQIKMMDVKEHKINNLPVKENRYSQISQSNFDKIPGSPIAYWASENLINDFEDSIKLDQKYPAKKGLVSGDNDYFLRYWFEPIFNNICFKNQNTNSKYNFVKPPYLYAPMNKGGRFRKWYGNNNYVIKFNEDAFDIIDANKGHRSPELYFKMAVTWSAVTSGAPSFRYSQPGFVGGSGGYSIFVDKSIDTYKLLGILNSKVGNYILNILNPTINIQAGDVKRFPLKKNIIDTLKIKNSISISKQDWDAFETSWDFQKSPLLTQNTASLHQAYNSWSNEALTRFNQLKSNEEELNRIFINLYGLQDELTPEEDDKEVSVRKADQVRDIKAFLSYFIGCVFGRYSLDQDGLVYAGGDWDDSKYTTFKPNKENIILLTDRQYFDDDRDIIIRLKEFLTKTFDPETLTENMDFIAQTLEPKKFERGASAEDIIRNYFLNDFYKDHAKIYQKRPIYWEFNSGRNKGFKALMYLHRYNTEQLPMVRHYLHELQPAMNDLIEVDQNLLDQETTASAKSKYRKAIATLNKQMNEIMKYDQILDHLSQSPVDLDLDDGVLVNHDKLQQGEKLLSKL
ncbi:putative Type II restriction enzyme, methylase subunit [Lactobacillus amylovorus GRL1118]|uniref:BREX-1 system adenine-specific DNA-methyltransferase PglX n=1 Tax=Lactobacillus amylovorus TaxID=1604 RepID=UPI0002015D15|nr:BREX-1 system adenine-specific DNA-methyltransferase PglX [Lactobacillus amylovorus]AEA31992.1 putative Type II restriction enzyme, methylase subunit [Lactobacillus amylovorus GRL1118]